MVKAPFRTKASNWYQLEGKSPDALKKNRDIPTSLLGIY